MDFFLINKEGLVWNAKVKCSLGCSEQETVEFKIPRAARRMRSKIANMDFRRADFGLFTNLLSRVPRDKALEGRGA